LLSKHCRATATQNVVANFDISAEGSKDGLNITELDKKTMTNMCSMDYKTIFYNYPARADIEFETQRYQVSDYVQNFDAFRQLNVEDLTGDRGVLKLVKTKNIRKTIRYPPREIILLMLFIKI